MTYFTLILIAFSLALDAFAVSISAGLTQKKVSYSKSFILALTFGLFQAIMPVIGWIGGVSVKGYIERYDHWIAFVLLGTIGINMIHEALSEEEAEKRDYFKFSSLITLGVATSIDALIVGISFALMEVNIWKTSLIIGSITALLCLIGVTLGSKFGHHFGKKAEIFGGSILIFLGVKIFLEHTLHI